MVVNLYKDQFGLIPNLKRHILSPYYVIMASTMTTSCIALTGKNDKEKPCHTLIFYKSGKNTLQKES